MNPNIKTYQKNTRKLPITGMFSTEGKKKNRKLIIIARAPQPNPGGLSSFFTANTLHFSAETYRTRKVKESKGLA
jgi:hypothetical protein